MKQAQRNLNQRRNAKLMKKLGGYSSEGWTKRNQEIAKKVQKTIDNQKRMAVERAKEKAKLI